MKIVSIVGARPQFVKLAPVDEELKKRGHEHVIIHTGQHYDYEMSKAFFEQLDIPEPDYNLEVGSGTHAYQTGQMLIRLGETLEVEQPELVIVYGDTNSTLAGALAAIKLRIPTAHVEAGYRSYDLTMPEEVNRVVTDRISQILFAPTHYAVENLIKEGIDKDAIYMVGDIMTEALLKNLQRAKNSDILERLSLEPQSYVLMTLHRQENVDYAHRLEKIFHGLKDIPLPIVFPCHPRTEKRLSEFRTLEKAGYDPAKLKIIKPLPYLDFLKLESEAAFLITDSGGVQSEALVLNKPCITLRYRTEKIETIEAGSNELAGVDPENIKEAVKNAYRKHKEKIEFKLPENWDERVSKRIADAIENHPDLDKLLAVPEDFSFPF
jgi:UDP-N-acetylglucosamine 2-epimerase (non-hydrolysing)